MVKKWEKKSRNALKTLGYFWQVTVKHKWLALGAFILTPVVIVIRSALIPLVMSEMIGVVSEGLLQEELVTRILPMAGTLMVLYVISSFVLEKLRTFCAWRLELKSMYDLSSRVFEVVSAQSMQFHTDRFSGSLVSQANRFVSAYERLMDEIIWNILPWVTAIISYIVILFPRAPIFTIIMVVLIFVYALISGLMSKPIARLNKKEAETSNKMTGQLSDSVSNITVVKSYAREKYEQKRYAGFNHDWYVAANKSMRAHIMREIFFSFVNVGLVGATVYLMVSGTTVFGLSVATLVLIINYSQQVLGSLWDLNSIFRTFTRVFGDAYEMTEILGLKDDVVDTPNAKKLEVGVTAGVDFDHISFKHPGAKQAIFEDFSLEIPMGQSVGLVGVSGSGKTTLTKLLLRFADVKKGAICIDGQDIRDVTQKSLREAIAYVPQESSLFHRSVFENIAYGRPDATDEEVYEAARLANADEFIAGLPEGYDTMVGERGVKLSGGQRQRIAIARAILKDAPILVLDEATSALDSESEALIQGALTNLMQGRTSIVVAHRLSTIAGLDRIVVLNNGVIVEQGTHTELLKAGGEYAKLWDRQSGAFLK
ncbi:ABC transporter ATP-binding protein [Candidatus Saccharibacteria bacterium]|nr:ABC transporter ATP-binding protein [Candidatus Saccharibacteria bacterium]